MSFVPVYDLQVLTDVQRQEYIKAVCRHLNVPEDLNLVVLAYYDSGDGPRRMVAYAKRGACEIIRKNMGINVVGLTNEMVNGSIVFTATGKDSTGHQEMSVGSKFVKDLTGKALDDGIMTAQTRAVRRMTLQFVGGGVLDESEVNSASTDVSSVATPLSQLALAPQPTSAPSSAPGTDITEKKTEIIQTSLIPTPEQLAAQDALKKVPPVSPETRAQVIEKLNEEAKAEEPAPKKTRKRRSKAAVDMGESAPPPMQATSNTVVATPMTELVSAPVPVTPAVIVAEKVAQAVVIPVAPPKLSPDQVKPFRQRLFKIVNDQLEPAGFAPKEGIGNADKMRNLASIMFSDVSNLNQMTVEQWEKYLSTLESKLQSVGAQGTIKYIEDAIGI